MILARHHGGGVIAFTFLVALLLTIMPLPEWLRVLRPDWVGLVLIYWCMAMPERVGVVSGWLSGLVVDLLTGAVLGQHALALAVVAWLTIRLHQRMRLYPIMQQAGTVLVLLVLHQLLALWISRFTGRPGVDWHYWAPSFIGMLAWPLVYNSLRSIRRGFLIN
jgi:rod shape-determining protein MreD